MDTFFVERSEEREGISEEDVESECTSVFGGELGCATAGEAEEGGDVVVEELRFRANKVAFSSSC